MFGYLAFYGSSKKEIYASSLYEAKLNAIKEFRVPKSKAHLISVILCEKAGESVSFSSASL